MLEDVKGRGAVFRHAYGTDDLFLPNSRYRLCAAGFLGFVEPRVMVSHAPVEQNQYQQPLLDHSGFPCEGGTDRLNPAPPANIANGIQAHP